MESFAESGWEFKDAVVCHENDHIAGGIEHGGAYLACLEMPVDVGAELRVYVVLDVGRDVLPDVFAVDSHLRPPNQRRFVGAKPLSWGARSRCSRALARCSRTFTEASLIPIAAAVSLISISSMSLSSTTLRYISGKPSMAF